MLIFAGRRVPPPRPQLQPRRRCRRGASFFTLQLLLNAFGDTGQLGRRVSRYIDLDDEATRRQLSPHSQREHTAAMAGLRQYFIDTGVFSDDGGSESGGSSDDDDDEDDGLGGVAAGGAGSDSDAFSDNDDDDDGGGQHGPGLNAMPGATTADNYGRPPPFTTEHCPPLPAGSGPLPADQCDCASGPQFCICCGLMETWLQRELTLASDSADEVCPSDDRPCHLCTHALCRPVFVCVPQDRELNNIQRKRCYRRAAIEHLHYKFRQPLPACVVVAIRRAWPSATGRYMGYKAR